MSARFHDSIGELPSTEEIYSKRCRFCFSNLITKDIPDQWPIGIGEIQLSHNRVIEGMAEIHGDFIREETELYPQFETLGVSCGICPVCGWWFIDKELMLSTKSQVWFMSYAVGSALKSLDLKDIRTPVEEIRKYLAANYDARYFINPAKFEEVVGSVFASVGYNSRVTSVSNDGGIDVVLSDSDGTQIGVQVKRYRGKIEVEQIRSLLGALILGGHTRGVFVTTSNFQPGAYRCAINSRKRGTRIDLIDADGFLNLLKVAQLSDFEDKIRSNNWVPYINKPKLEFASEYHGNSL